MIMVSSNFIFNFTSICVLVSFFLIKLRTLVTLFSTVLRATAVAKLVMLGILLLNSFILALIAVVAAKLVLLGILSLIFFILAFYIHLLNSIIFYYIT